MKARELDQLLAAANPVDPGRLDGVDLVAIEADLDLDLAAASGAPAGTGSPTDAALVPPRRARVRPRLVLAGAGAALAVVVALVLILAGSGSDRGSKAYGAEAIRFAESTPLLLLEGPGWRVEEVGEGRTREGTYGLMQFVHGKPFRLPPSLETGNVETGQYIHHLAPAALRQRKVELSWRTETLAGADAMLRGGLHPHGLHLVRRPVLDTTALVDTRAEIFVNQGGPGDREMVAIWSEGNNVITLRADVPDLAAMEERLGWVTKVDSQTWLEAMPAKVIAAAEVESSYREILKGIPLPKTFAFSRIPDEGLTTTREQATDRVTGTVACLWLRQWGEARRSGDEAAEVEATRALAGSKSWPIFRAEGADAPYTAAEIQEVAAAMKRGYWIYRGHPQDLLKHAESLGCAREGLPLLPEKMERQREEGVPPPPD
jgi:hypothetical protein